MEVRPERTMTELIRDNNGANQQVLAACQKLSQDQLVATMRGAYGSLRDPLEHIIRAEAYYVGLWTGKRPPPPFQRKAKPGLAEMRECATQVGNALVAAINHVRPTERVSQEWQGKPVDYQALAVFIQIINHGIEHRTNITTILNQGQVTLPAVDGWGSLWADPGRFDMQ